MKRAILLFVTFTVSFLFFSCRSFKIIDVETYNPSAITFPPEIKTVMIVNNSAQQPDAIGHRYVNSIISDSVLSVSADSSAYLFCMSLGKTMAESPLFKDVRMCEDTLRRDSLFYDIRQFSARRVKAVCNEYGVDALISLDKLFFSTVYFENITNRNNIVNLSIHMQITGEMRALWPGQKEAFVVPFIDSLSWIYRSEDFLNDKIEALTRSDIENILHYLSDVTGQKMQVNFIPFWVEEKRWYYTSISSGWKQGTVYAAAEKWGEAAKIWEPLYGKVKNWKQKARLASNLATCYEMTGDFKKAIEYAEISYGLFNEFDEADSLYTSIQRNYVIILKQREEKEEELSKQLSEKIDNNP